MMEEALVRNSEPVEQLRVISQNVQRNSVHVEIMLNTCIHDYDIIFIQEPPIRELRKAPSSSDKEGEAVIGAPIHPDWLYMARPINSSDRMPRVMAYVNKRLKHMRPSLRLDLVNHLDIQVLSLFNEEREYCLLNVYNADTQHAGHDYFKIIFCEKL